MRKTAIGGAKILAFLAIYLLAARAVGVGWPLALLLLPALVAILAAAIVAGVVVLLIALAGAATIDWIRDPDQYKYVHWDD